VFRNPTSTTTGCFAPVRESFNFTEIRTVFQNPFNSLEAEPRRKGPRVATHARLGV
jgi:hypothetical protein